MDSGVDSLLASRHAIKRYMSLVSETYAALERSRATLERSKRLQQADVLKVNLYGAQKNR